MSGKLHTQAARGKQYVKYYDSQDTPLNYAQKKFAEIFGELFKGYRDNFAPLIVDSISERLSIRGFRMGPDEESDEDAWKIWQRSFLDADSNAAHIDSLVQGTSFLIVWEDDDKQPLITPESASEVTVQYAAGSRRLVEAGYREFIDDWGVIHGTLFLPDAVYTSEKGNDQFSEPERSNNPLGIVPIVPLTNRKRLRAEPFSELAAIIPIQDAINKVSADAIVASEFAAFPQRVISGLEPFETMEDERKAMLKAYVDRILNLDGDDVKWGQFEAADLSNYVRLIDMLVQHMASQSRVPFHYFLLNGGTAPSGESITAAEAGLVAKAKERMLHFGESWETAMRIAFQILGDPRAKAFDAETIWADPEHRSRGALMDSLLKAKDINVPDKQLWEDYGYSFSQIERFDEMNKEQDEKELAQAKKMAAVTGAEGGSAPAGNGTKAPAKSASVERQREKRNRAA